MLKKTTKEPTLEDYYKKIVNRYQDEHETYFHRETIPFSEKQIIDWEEEQLQPLLNDIRYWYDSDYKWPRYYNSQALQNKYGLARMARMIVDGDEKGYYRKERTHSELGK